ncbi:MAG: NUDIX domain-containing protein [Thermoplasmata archaeon]|jgi:8-oxo-dGTP pyrophosphatase MutT (NUDIX family)
MSEVDLRRAMTLPALGVAPGRATGAAHLVDDPLRWESGRPSPEVLALPALWWPPTESLPPGVVAVLLHGVPVETGPAGEMPVIARVDPEVVREGEIVEVNGTIGRFRIDGVEEVEVVTAFLERDDGRILLLERSEKVGSFRGHWAAVSGYLETAPPLEQAFREIQEETGLGSNDVELVHSGFPVLARDGSRVFIVHPFRFRVRRTEVRLDWEHTRSEWVEPAEITRRRTVPKLDRAWESVASPPTKG